MRALGLVPVLLLPFAARAAEAPLRCRTAAAGLLDPARQQLFIAELGNDSVARPI
jgi:hypothetical protein